MSLQNWGSGPFNEGDDNHWHGRHQAANALGGRVSDTCIQCLLEASVLKSSDKAQLSEVNKMII